MRRVRAFALLLPLVVVASTLAACSRGHDRVHATATFPDVADLAAGAPVMLADVPIGSVTSIHLARGGRAARVALSFDRSAKVPAAVEAREEAGVEGEVDTQPIGTYPYLKRLKDGETRPLSVEMFALRVARELPEWPEQGQRQRRWFTPLEAAQSVDEDELADIIRAFNPPL